MSKNFLLLSGLLFSSSAIAGGFEGKTMRDPFSNRSVERGLVLGKGWFQLGLGSNYKLSTGEWSPDGEKDDWAATSWMYTTQHLNIRYGITRNVELSWKVTSHYVALTNSDLGTDISQYGLGDPEMGAKYQILRKTAPMTSVIAYTLYKAPLANEMPGNYVASPNAFSSFVMTTGTPDLTTGVAAKKQFGPAALTVDLAHTHRFSGLASYALETDANQFQVRVKPGNVKKVDVAVEGQGGPVNISAGAIYQHRSTFQIGTTSAGFFPNKNLNDVLDSDGWSLDAKAGLTLNVFQTLDIKGTALIPLRGEDLLFFPLEDVHPTTGNVYSGELIYRF